MTSGQVGPKSGKLAKGGIVIGGVTKEQIAQAKSIDLLSYLQANEPGNLKKSGRNEYRLADHDSLKISNGRWHWFSRGIGGKTALDYLIHVRGMAFVDAVKLLTDDGGVDFSFQTVKNFVPKEPERKPFTLPAASKDNSRVMAYLTGRGIDCDIIDLCFERKILYESAQNHNAVFVGMDINNAARFACMRGTQGSFKQDVTGSDKRFNFCLRPSDPASRFLAVFESPADAFLLLQSARWAQAHGMIFTIYRLAALPRWRLCNICKTIPISIMCIYAWTTTGRAMRGWRKLSG